MVTINLKVSMCRDTFANSNITKVFVLNPCDSCNTDVDISLNVIHVHVTQQHCVYRDCYGLFSLKPYIRFFITFTFSLLQKLSSERRARYALTEPKLDTKHMYVKLIKQRIVQKPSLRRNLLNAFKSARKPLAEKIKTNKLTYAVSSIAPRSLLQRVLKVRKQSVGELLA